MIPCVNGCIKCGFCCVALTIDDEDLQKPAFSLCKNLKYVGNEAICSIHGPNKPQTCLNYEPETRFKLLWFDDRFRYYKQEGYMRHLIWMTAQGYCDHLPVIKAIKSCEYKQLAKVFRYFVRPFLISKPETLAGNEFWLESWPGLTNYLSNMDQENQATFYEMINNLTVGRKWTNNLSIRIINSLLKEANYA